MHRSLPIFIILIAVLGSAFSQGTKAQESKAESTDSALTSQSSPESSEVLEEVVVIGTRVEAGGSRRRTAAGRDELDASDQTEMEGFFDDIDAFVHPVFDGCCMPRWLI
jgi:hypothetical protein